MKAIHNFFFASAIFAGSCSVAAAGVTELPEPGVTMPANPNPGYVRTWDDRQRDVYEHPYVGVIVFGNVGRDTTLLEVLPTDHYWSALFATAAPVRHFIQAADQNDKAGWDQRVKERDFFAWHNNAKVELRPLSYDSLADPTAVDVVLMDKKMGKLMADGNLNKVLGSARKALKLGGTLLVIDYRATNDGPQDPKAANGFIREDYAIDTIQKAGFVLEDREDKLLANPKDTRAKVANDSDRFILKFKKWDPPAACTPTSIHCLEVNR